MIEIPYFVHGTTQDNIEKKSTGWLPWDYQKKTYNKKLTLHIQLKMNILYCLCSDLSCLLNTIIKELL